MTWAPLGFAGYGPHCAVFASSAELLDEDTQYNRRKKTLLDGATDAFQAFFNQDLASTIKHG